MAFTYGTIPGRDSDFGKGKILQVRESTSEKPRFSLVRIPGQGCSLVKAQPGAFMDLGGQRYVVGDPVLARVP